jgi:hypothetical protein
VDTSGTGVVPSAVLLRLITIMSFHSSRHSPCTSYESHSYSYSHSSSLSSGHISGSTSDRQTSDGYSKSNSFHSHTKSSQESPNAAEVAHDSSCDSTTHTRIRSQLQMPPLVRSQSDFRLQTPPIARTHLPSLPSPTSTSSSSSIVLLRRTHTPALAPSGSHHKTHVAAFPDMPLPARTLNSGTAWQFVRAYAHELGVQAECTTRPPPRVDGEHQSTVRVCGRRLGVGFGMSEVQALREAVVDAAAHLLEDEPLLRRLLPTEVQRPAVILRPARTTTLRQPSATKASSLPPPALQATGGVLQAQARTLGGKEHNRFTPQDEPTLARVHTGGPRAPCHARKIEPPDSSSSSSARCRTSSSSYCGSASSCAHASSGGCCKSRKSRRCSACTRYGARAIRHDQTLELLGFSSSSSSRGGSRSSSDFRTSNSCACMHSKWSRRTRKARRFSASTHSGVLTFCSCLSRTIYTPGKRLSEPFAGYILEAGDTPSLYQARGTSGPSCSHI